MVLLALLVLAAVANNSLWYDGSLVQMGGRVLLLVAIILALLWAGRGGLNLFAAAVGLLSLSMGLGLVGAVGFYRPASTDVSATVDARSRARRAA